MFLAIEKHKEENIALIDDDKNRVTYKDICDFCHIYNKIVKKRSLVFLLCKNTVGAVINYLSCL